MAIQAQIKRKRGQHGPLRHGGYSFLTKGADAIPAKRGYIKDYLQGVRDGVVRDMGGEENMKTTQIVMCDRLVTALGVVRLIEEHVREKGVISSPQGFLHPSLSKGYIAYCNQVRLACQMLDGAPRPAEKLLTPAEILAEIARDEAGTAAGGPETGDLEAGQGEDLDHAGDAPDGDIPEGE